MARFHRPRFMDSWYAMPGHIRALLWPEPLWAIPYTLYGPYASIYQERLGLTPAQIGLIGSAAMALNVAASFFGAYFTDRLGRKRTMLYADILAWSVATAVWALSRNFWWFLAAGALNSLGAISGIAWSCLLVEDTAADERLPIFTWLQLLQLASGFFVPLAGLIVARFDVVLGARILYGLAFVSMSFMFYIRNRYVRESSVGLARMSHVRTIDWRQVGREYRRAIGFLVRHREFRALFIGSLAFNLNFVISGLYLGLFYTDHLGLSPAVISIFPTVTAAVMLVVTLWLPRIAAERARRYLAFGYGFGVAGLALLVTAPSHNLAWVAASVALTAIGSALVNPFFGVIWNGLIGDADRANIFSATFVIRTLLLTPAGAIGGWLFTLHAELPMAVVAIALVVGIAVYLPFAFPRGARPTSTGQVTN
ncbi:MAG: MFS transporter [Bacillota bacterium]